jgi:hypothetical protein
VVQPISEGTIPMKKSLSALLCAAIALAACTTIGTGSGSLGDKPVSFAWKSTDGGTTGTMTANLPDGKTFSGPYLQVTSEARTEDFAPMWAGWGYGWRDWNWGPYPATGFTTLYTNRVMANLKSADGQRMRCHFNLNHPYDGMVGGGQGQCQLRGSGTVDAVFPAA